VLHTTHHFDCRRELGFVLPFGEEVDYLLPIEIRKERQRVEDLTPCQEGHGRMLERCCPLPRKNDWKESGEKMTVVVVD
jgi:hypothetical protein